MARAHAALEHSTADLAGFYERAAVLVGRPAPYEVMLPVSVPAFVGLDGNSGTVLPGEVGDVDGTSGSDGASHADGAGEAGRGT